MVSTKEIRASNALINDATAPRVSVFVGGTSGIGKFTIKALVKTGASVRIYLVGRKSSAERMRGFIDELRAINPKADIIWTEAEIALLAETKRACELIKSKEPRVDLLFLTAGYAPFNGRNETAEGLEVTETLELFSRMLFTQHLLPLLSAAEAPKVVSVLSGGLESTSIKLDDMDLKQPGNFGGMKAQVQYGTMKTMAMERLARENPKVTFVHSWPGWVNTGSLRRSIDPNSFMGWMIWIFLENLLSFTSYSEEETGQRHLFQGTSAAFGGRGLRWEGKPGINSMGRPADGLFLVNHKCDCTPNAKAMGVLRETASEKVWNHMQEVLGPYL